MSQPSPESAPTVAARLPLLTATVLPDSPRWPGRVRRIRLDGELDFTTVGLLEALLAQAAHQRRRVVVLELSRLEFIDVAGLQRLVAESRRLRATGGRLTVVGLSPVGVRALRICGWHQELELRPVCSAA